MENGDDKGYHFCTCCGKSAINYEEDKDVVELLTPFCPWCGDKTNRDESILHPYSDMSGCLYQTYRQTDKTAL